MVVLLVGKAARLRRLSYTWTNSRGLWKTGLNNNNNEEEEEDKIGEGIEAGGE